MFIPLKRSRGNLCACVSLKDNPRLSNFVNFWRRVEFFTRIDGTTVSKNFVFGLIQRLWNTATTRIFNLLHVLSDTPSVSASIFESHLTQLFSRIASFWWILIQLSCLDFTFIECNLSVFSSCRERPTHCDSSDLGIPSSVSEISHFFHQPMTLHPLPHPTPSAHPCEKIPTRNVSQSFLLKIRSSHAPF
jgi:hypothetical protein